MRKNAGVRWARVEEDTRQLTVKCTRITDQRVGWVDRWIQVNRFTRPHVPCISAGCEVKSSGMKFKVLKGRNLQELAPLSFQIYETGLLHRSLNLLAADISNCFHFSNYLSSYLEKKEKKNIEKSSRMTESERILRVVIPILTVKERGEGKNHG